jgi:hypothetical protein
LFQKGWEKNNEIIPNNKAIKIKRFPEKREPFVYA